MKRLLLVAVLGMAMHPVAATEPPDGMSDYQRFVTYPHFQRGFAAQRRGDHAAAVAAFERARRHAPTSALTALHLAEAYRRAGRVLDAERLLASQRRLTPGDGRLAPRGPTAVVARRAPLPVPRGAGASSSRVGHDARATQQGGDVTERLASSPKAPSRAARVRRPETRADAPTEARLTAALAAGDREQTHRLAVALLAVAPRDGDLLDRVTYRLVQAGEAGFAARLLLDHWRETTSRHPAAAARLADLLADQPSHATVADRARLRGAYADADADAAGRAMDALEALRECDGMEALLPSLPQARHADGWMRVATCLATATPHRARDAWRRAVEAGAGPEAHRALAHAEFSLGDVEAALRAWSAMPVDAMTADDLIAAGNTAVAAGAAKRALPWLDAYAARGLVPVDGYWWLRAHVATPGSAAERDALHKALALREDVRYLVRLAALQREAGDTSGAVRSLERAQVLAPADAGIRAALGYAYVAAGRDADALPHLQAYRAAEPGRAAVAEDLAEVYRRLVQPERARELAHAAIGLLDPSAEPERVFRLARLREDLGRSWSLASDASFGTAVSSTGTDPGAAYRSYAQVEAQYRFGHAVGRPDGDALAAYARIFAGALDGGAAPNDGATLGIGLRWKPFAHRLLYVAAEHQKGLDRAAPDETLLRLSAAPLDDPSTSRDWHPAGPGWWSRSLYLDVAHYLRAGQTGLTADYQAGRHFKLGAGHTLEPYLRIQATGLIDRDGSRRDLRVGLGARWNVWYGGDRYTAYPHRFALGLEAQRAVDTYLPDRGTLLVTLGHLW